MPRRRRRAGDSREDAGRSKRRSGSPKRAQAAKEDGEDKERTACACGRSARELSLSTDEVEKPKIVKAKGQQERSFRHCARAGDFQQHHRDHYRSEGQRDRLVERRQGGLQGFAQKHRLRGANGRAGRLPSGDGPRAERSGSVSQRSGSRTRIRGARLAGIGLDLTVIRDVTPVPHNGCRPPKQRRV